MTRSVGRPPGTGLAVSVRPVRDLPDHLVLAWERLAAECEEPNPFYEAAAVRLASEHLADGASAMALLVTDGTDLVFVLPVQRRQRFRRVPAPALVGWRHPYCYLGTPLVRRGRAHECWAAVLDSFHAAADEVWLVLEQQRLEGPVAHALEETLRARGHKHARFDVAARPVLLRRPASTYLDGRISGRHLKALRRQRRRLADALGGPVARTDHAQDPAALEPAIEALLSTERAGWKGAAGTAMADRPGDAAFFRQLCTSMQAQSRLQLWSLGTPQRGAAYLATLLADDTVFHFKIAYDQELRAHSPGMLLELEMVEEFHTDARLARVDSCSDAEGTVSAQLYPDRQPVGTLLVPLRGVRGRAAARATPVAAEAYRAMRSGVARMSRQVRAIRQGRR